MTEAGSLTPSIHRVVVTAPGIEGLQYAPGQDLMLRVPLADDRVVNRRYTIRAFDPVERTVTIDVSLHGAGPGTDWMRAAADRRPDRRHRPPGQDHRPPGRRLALFVVDETGLPGRWR